MAGVYGMKPTSGTWRREWELGGAVATIKTAKKKRKYIHKRTKDLRYLHSILYVLHCDL